MYGGNGLRYSCALMDTHSMRLGDVPLQSGGSSVLSGDNQNLAQLQTPNSLALRHLTITSRPKSEGSQWGKREGDPTSASMDGGAKDVGAVDGRTRVGERLTRDERREFNRWSTT
jgi:hypothetical protein